MTASAIEAIYVYDQSNEIVVEHTFFSRPPSARSCLQAYLSLPRPRPAVSHHASLSPPATFATSRHNGLLLLVPSTRESDPLVALTFIGRLVDILEDFVGAPLLAAKIAASYDVVAQVLSEMVDGGSIASTEPNALKDTVTTQGWVDKLLGGVGLPSGPAPSLQTSGSSAFGVGSSGVSSTGIGALRPSPLSNQSSGPQVPWRRPNVRHTSNELYVDLVESLKVLLAPSGRPLSARVHGSVLFTAKLSGVPDLILNLTATGGGRSHVGKMIEAPAFHPCVRLNRWRDNPGELSFVPPDGKFMLAGYEVDLLPEATSKNGSITDRSARQLDLPVTVQVKKSLGATGMEFEVRLGISGSFGPKGGSGPAAAQLRALSGLGGGSAPGSGRSTPSIFGTRDSGTSSAPTMNDIIVQVPLPPAVRNITDLRASRGEASFNVGTHVVRWHVGAKEASGSGVATLRCTVVGPPGAEEEENELPASYGTTGMGDYDENTDSYQDNEDEKPKRTMPQTKPEDEDARKIHANRKYMPMSATVSFSVKGWLASGLKVDSLNIDTRRSKGLGDGVKPVKGAKYLTVSKQGVETRC